MTAYPAGAMVTTGVWLRAVAAGPWDCPVEEGRPPASTRTGDARKCPGGDLAEYSSSSHAGSKFGYLPFLAL